MRTQVVPLAEEHFQQLHAVADAVAREQRYLAMLQAPPYQEAVAFFRSVLATDQCHVALQDGAVVGWCDVLPVFGESRRYVGVLGSGLSRAFRGRGVGSALLAATIETAWSHGPTRIELTVRQDNINARRLYERSGLFTRASSSGPSWSMGSTSPLMSWRCSSQMTLTFRSSGAATARQRARESLVATLRLAGATPLPPA